MKKLEGIHFYININNLNNIVEDEEYKTGIVNHSIHALDTYFTCIEKFAKTNFSEVVIEKITGSRLHMYVLITSETTVLKAYVIAIMIVFFAKKLADYLGTDVLKYKTLKPFQIQAGACLGEFYNFNFKGENTEEKTSIGFAANYAAKLQGLCSEGELAISNNIFEALDSHEQGKYRKDPNAESVRKYGEGCFYKISINNIFDGPKYAKELEICKAYADKVNLTDITFGKVEEKLNLDNLSKVKCKKLQGIPLFADIREFTKQFDNEDNNLDLMAAMTQKTLKAMYSIILQNNGLHIQFQGDREFALFHDWEGHHCCIDAVKAGLQLLDMVSGVRFFIGIGQAFGKVFATKIGAHGEKDFMLIGSTVSEADINEDKYAGKNQLVISLKIYAILKQERPEWIDIFKEGRDKDGGIYYYTTEGYTQLVQRLKLGQLRVANKSGSYNGAWGR